MRILILKARFLANKLYNKIEYISKLIKFDHLNTEDTQLERYENMKILQEAYDIIQELEQTLSSKFYENMEN